MRNHASVIAGVLALFLSFAASAGGIGAGNGGDARCAEYSDMAGKIASALLTVGQAKVDAVVPVVRVDDLWKIYQNLKCFPVKELDRQALSYPGQDRTELLGSSWEQMHPSEKYRLVYHELAVLAGYEKDGEYSVSDKMSQILSASSEVTFVADSYYLVANRTLGTKIYSIDLCEHQVATVLPKDQPFECAQDKDKCLSVSPIERMANCRSVIDGQIVDFEKLSEKLKSSQAAFIKDYPDQYQQLKDQASEDKVKALLVGAAGVAQVAAFIGTGWVNLGAVMILSSIGKYGDAELTVDSYFHFNNSVVRYAGSLMESVKDPDKQLGRSFVLGQYSPNDGSVQWLLKGWGDSSVEPLEVFSSKMKKTFSMSPEEIAKDEEVGWNFKYGNSNPSHYKGK